MCRFPCVRVCCSVGMQRCAAEDNLDMVSASVYDIVLALLGGGVCPVAGWHSFLYEGRIPPWWRSHSRYGFSSVQCCHWRGTLCVWLFITQRSQGPAC